MKIGSAIARVFGDYGIDILNVPSRFEDAVLQLIDRDSFEGEAIEKGCDARFLGFFHQAVEKGDADALDVASEKAARYLHDNYGVDENVARELAETISDAVAEHMNISMGSSNRSRGIQHDENTVSSSFNPIPEVIDNDDTLGETFTGFEDIFLQDGPSFDNAGYGGSMQPNNTGAMGGYPKSGMTAPVQVGDGWTTPASDVPSNPTAPVVQQKKPQVPLIAMIAAVGIVGAIGVGVGVAMSSGHKDPAPVVQEQPVTEEPDEPATKEEPTKEEPAPEETEEVDRAKQLALEKAQTYLEWMSFSYDGLVEMLEYDGFNHEEAVYAADNCGADWMEQAVLRAKSYLDSSSFSEVGLIDQLEFEGFTKEQAEHGVAECGADWMEQAVLEAKSWLKYDSSMTRDEVLEMLVDVDGYTQEQAEHGVEVAFSEA